MRLFHFSDDAAIGTFTPRSVLVPSQRAPGMEWLNGPLVWAIEEPLDFMYLFPRDCPRILMGNRANERRGQDEMARRLSRSGLHRT